MPHVATSLADLLAALAGAAHVEGDKLVIDDEAKFRADAIKDLAWTAAFTTDEPTALTDAYAFIKVTHLERPGTDMRVVVNMANSIREGERVYATLLKACEGFLKISPPLAGVIRRDLKVRDAIRNQTPILTRSPNAEAAADVEALVERLLNP